MILLLTDSHGHPCLPRLQADLLELGAESLLYPADRFPSQQLLSIHGGRAWLAEPAIDFEEVRAAYIHRFMPGAPDANLDPALTALSITTSRAALQDALEHTPCINNLQSASDSASRLRQLRLAEELGFRVPETVVTNDPATARDFLQTYGNAVVRFVVPATAAQEPGPGPHRAQLLTAEHLDANPRDFRSIPRLLQRHVPKTNDVRCLYCAGTLFAAALHEPEQRSPDWRRSYARPWRPIELDKAMQSKIHALMEAAGLSLATLDFADDHFLDLNPYGEWFWMQTSLNMPITRTLAKALLN